MPNSYPAPLPKASSTAEVLERTDQVTFEKLADGLLRSANSDYAAIMHFGINAKGKSVKSPVDGFCKVPGSDPARFIYVQHTTTDKKSLRGKWLNETSDLNTKKGREKGDLIKAGELAYKLRNIFPNALFTVVLTSNQALDVELSKDTHVKSAQLQLSLDIWEQTRITRFLDDKPDGQWLRWRHLGIAAEQFSSSLFDELCSRSLDSYLGNLPSESNSWVTRDIEEQLDEVLAYSNYSLSLLVAESGQGKSVLCARKFKRLLEAGGSCLWASADLVQLSNSVEELIVQVVRSLEPSLWPGANQAILGIISKRELMLIVDDVNRSPDPSSLVRKLSAWLSPRGSSSSSDPSASKIQALCPVWSSTISQFASESKSFSWVRIVSFGLMSETEADTAVETGALIARRPVSPIERRSIADELARDPYLIGLWCNLITAKSHSSAIDLARNVQEGFLSDSLAQTVARHPQVTVADLREALEALSNAMLLNRKMSPSQSDAWKWLSGRGDIRNALSLILNHGRLIRLDSNGSILFRHDRLRDLLLQLALPQALKDDPSLVSDPFFTRYFGTAVADGQIIEDFIPELRRHNPLALFEAIARFGTPSKPLHEVIIRHATDWIEQEVITSRAIPNLIWQVSGALYRTDSPIVLRLTEKMPQNGYVLAARLRNGCARSGAIRCGQYQGMFQPSVRDSFFENTLSHAIRHHRQQLLQGVCECLNNAAQPQWQLHGAILMAGFIADPALLPMILKAWRNSSEQTNALPSAIWASLRCATDQDFQLFDELLKYWNTLSTIEGTHGLSESSNIWSWLHRSFHWIQSGGLKWLLRAAEGESQAAKHLARLIDNIDDPEAVAFIVKKDAATIKAKPNTEENLSSWYLMRFRHWDPRDTTAGRSLSKASQNRLLGIWNNTAEDPICRKIAFRLWSLGANKEHVPLMQRILSEDSIFDSTLWKRAELGDFSIAPFVAEKIRNSAHWCWVANSIWCLEIKTAVESLLQVQTGKTTGEFSEYGSYEISSVADLFTRIPVLEAEMLLDKYWNHFGKSGDFVICALHVGTTRSRELAALSINSCPKEINLLRYAYMRMGRRTGDPDDSASRYTLLQSLEPHLERLSLEDIRGFGWEVELGKHYEWYQKFLKDRLSPGDRARLFPNDGDLTNELDDFEKNPHRLPRFWLEDLERRRVTTKRLWPILESWFMSSPSTKRQETVFEIIEIAGTRRELPLLQRVSKALNTPLNDRAAVNVNFAVCLRTLS